MKVLLINPPSFNLYFQLGAKLPPLGLCYLAAVLRKEGHHVHLVDFEVEPERELKFEQYDLVGISSDTPRYRKALAIAKQAKEQGLPVVMGGYHVTFLDEEALSTGLVDYVVRGEGEYILLELVDSLEHDRDLSRVRGLSFMLKGRYQRNPDAPFIDDLDALPFPARDLLPMDHYVTLSEGRPMTSIITSRGCPFNCSFCSVSRFSGRRWRARSLDSILAEIEFLKSTYGFQSFSFVDDNFTLNPRRVIQFTEKLKARNLNISWWCLSRVDTIVKNEEMVKRMAETGAKTIFLGLESGSQEVLNNYDKKITLWQQRKAIEILKRYKIRVWGSFIIGNLRETKEMIKRTIDFARKFKLHISQFSILTPYPGTLLFDFLKKENRIITYNWDYYDGAHAVIKIDTLTPSELQKLLIKAYKGFYLQLSRLPGLIFKILRKKICVKTLLQRALSTIKIMHFLKTTVISETK